MQRYVITHGITICHLTWVLFTIATYVQQLWFVSCAAPTVWKNNFLHIGQLKLQNVSKLGNFTISYQVTLKSINLLAKQISYKQQNCFNVSYANFELKGNV